MKIENYKEKYIIDFSDVDTGNKPNVPMWRILERTNDTVGEYPIYKQVGKSFLVEKEAEKLLLELQGKR